MSTRKIVYGSKTALSITLASLGSAAVRSSAFVNNDSNKYVDAIVGGKITAGTSPSATGTIAVYAYGTVDPDETTPRYSGAYDGEVDGTDKAITKKDNSARLLGRFQLETTTGRVLNLPPMSVAAVFGGVLPEEWGILIENETGVALNSTESNHGLWYQGLHYEDV